MIDLRHRSQIASRHLVYNQSENDPRELLADVLRAYTLRVDSEKDILTDACKIFVIKKGKVKIVMGEVFNVKVTTMHDYKICNAILMERNK